MNIQDAIDTIESVAGFTDETTPVGEAWMEVLSYVNRRTAPTPQRLADGEVGEVVKRLGWIAAQLADIGWSDDAASIDGAADLLERLASPACYVLNPSLEALAALEAAGPGIIEAMPAERMWPVLVPVSERPWERDGWCNEEGRCWMGDPGGGEFIPSWRLCRPKDAPNMQASLPFNALPLPETTND